MVSAVVEAGGRPAETRGRSVAATAIVEAEVPGVAWGAAIGGAFIIGAVGIILVALGAGFGLSSVSPWPRAGVTLTTFTAMSAIWFVIVQWLSSGVGGYVAGRLCAQAPRLHPDDAYFRDTAHGVLAWAVAAVVSIAVFASAATLVAGGTALTGASLASSGAPALAASSGIDPYLIDTLYRSDKPDANASTADVRSETTRVLAMGVKNGGVPAADKVYLAQLVAARTGISQDDAQKRVDNAIAQAQQAANAARKAAMQFSIYMAFSMLVGAFVAAVAGRLGGHRRDELALR